MPWTCFLCLLCYKSFISRKNIYESQIFICCTILHGYFLLKAWLVKWVDHSFKYEWLLDDWYQRILNNCGKLQLLNYLVILLGDTLFPSFILLLKLLFYQIHTYQSDKFVPNVHLSVEVRMSLEMLSIGSNPKASSHKHFENH